MRHVRTLLVLSAALIALSPPADARERRIPGVVFDTVTAPLRIIAGAVSGRRHARARHSYARHSRSGPRSRAAAVAPSVGAASPDLPRSPEIAAAPAAPSQYQLATTGAEARREPRPSAAQQWLAASGWLGPLYWPYASDDLVDYLLSPSNAGDWFWARGAGDLFDAIFMRAGDTKAVWADMCGGRRGGSNVWIDPIRQAVEPTAAQVPPLNALRDAIVQTGNEIRLSCPAHEDTANPGQRLEAMTERLWALRQAAIIFRAPLESFVNSLTGNQRARLNAIKNETLARPITATNAIGQQANVQACSVPASPFADWPADQIEQRVRPTDEQRQALDTLRLTTLGMTRLLMESCPAEPPDTPLARLDAVEKRLDGLLYAARIVAPAVHKFYGTLSDEQKVAFHSIGRPPGRQPAVAGRDR